MSQLRYLNKMHITFLIKTTIDDVFGRQANKDIGFWGKAFGNLRMLAPRASPTKWFCIENHDNWLNSF